MIYPQITQISADSAVLSLSLKFMAETKTCLLFYPQITQIYADLDAVEKQSLKFCASCGLFIRRLRRFTQIWVL